MNFKLTALEKAHDISSVISQRGKSRSGCYKKTKHAKFSKKPKFLATWYAHVRVRMKGQQMLVFGKFGVLCFLVTTIFKFALLPYYRRYDASKLVTWLIGILQTSSKVTFTSISLFKPTKINEPKRKLFHFEEIYQ